MCRNNGIKIEMIKKNWVKLTPDMQLFCLFFSMFIGIIIGALIIKIFLSTERTFQVTVLQQIITSCCIFLIPTLFCSFCLHIFNFHSFFKGQLNIILFLLVLLIFICSIPFIQLSGKLSSFIHLESFSPSLQQYFAESKESSMKVISSLFPDKSPFTLIISLVVIALTPAIVEELFFRGCLQTTILKFFKSYHVSIWVTALIFSAFHLQLDGFFTRLFLGALLGYLYYYSQNILYPIIFHFMNNAIIAIAIFFWGVDKANNFEFAENLGLIAILGIVSLLFVIGLTVFFNKKTHTLKS